MRKYTTHRRTSLKIFFDLPEIVHNYGCTASRLGYNNLSIFAGQNQIHEFPTETILRGVYRAYGDVNIVPILEVHKVEE